MANYGLPGPKNALVPFGPEPAKAPSPVHSDLDIPALLEELGLTTTRVHVRDQTNSEFDRISAGARLLTEESFQTATAQLFAFSRRASRSCFHACDLDGSQRLDKNEYLLFKEAFIHPESEKFQHQAVLDLRLRAIFHKYVLSRPAQRRSSAEESWTEDEVLQWVKDMCGTDAHVKRVAGAVLPHLKEALVPVEENNSDGASRSDSKQREWLSHVNLEQFLQAAQQDHLQEALRTEGLTTEDLIQSLHEGVSAQHFTRVVLDGRAEAARMPSERALQMKQPPRFGVDSDIVGALAVNADMELDPHLRAVGGWRGPMAPARPSEEYVVAMRVITTAMQMARDLTREMDVPDSAWMPNEAALRLMLGPSKRKQAENIILLSRACQEQLRSQPSLVRVPAPAKVFGDVHGQLRDLLLLFAQFGMPTHCGGDIQTTSYVFNGDWVDRGEHQLEVVCLMFALKTVYPSHVFLIRGNHEFRYMNEFMEEDGFLAQVEQKVPFNAEQVFEAIHSTFDWLPLAALIGGKVLVLHGGIGDGSWGLKELEQVRRPLVEDYGGPGNCVMDALWSDPSDSDHSMRKGVHHNRDRGGGGRIHEFGPDVTAAFCKRENVSLIVRSHQFVRHGYKVMHGGHLLTLFSARNYLEEESNDGALLLLAQDINGHLRVHPKRLVQLLGGLPRVPRSCPARCWAKARTWLPCLPARAPCLGIRM